MSGLFGTLNVSNKGMQASQTALQTTSHNISNANTEGYSRQRVELKADLAYTLSGIGQLGSGVKMDSIIRLVDDYVTKQIRGENGTFSQYTAKSEILNQMEIIFNEPSDTSLNFNLGEMFDAWTELSKNPEMLTSKSIVAEKSKTVAQTINHMASQLEGLENNAVELIEMNAKKFNTIVDSLDSLNKQIFNTSVKGLIPNDLLDERDLLLKELSGITDFTADFSDKYNRVGISLGGKDVLTIEGVQFELSVVIEVDEDKAILSKGGDSLKESIAITGDYELGQIILNKKEDHALSDTIIDIEAKSGEIAGYQEALEEIKEQIVDLDKFAVTMAKAINDAHKDGADTPQTDFFTDDGNPTASYEKITAANIKVNQDIQDDNNKVNAGQGANPPEGDGSLALKIAGVRNKEYLYDKDPVTGQVSVIEDKTGNSIESIYNSMVTNIGISKQQSDNMISNQELLLNQLEMRRESTAGVNIDEEVTNLIKFQKSYQANARVIQVISEMLDTLINRTGV